MPKRASAAVSAAEGGLPDVNTNWAGEGAWDRGGPARSSTRRAIAGAGSRNVTGHGDSRVSRACSSG